MSIFFNNNSRKNSEDTAENFECVLALASKIINSKHPSRIYELIYSLGKSYQFEIINMCIKGKPLSSNLAFNIEHLFFKHADKFYNFTRVDETGKFINYFISHEGKRIDPSKVLIFTFPWEIDRLFGAFKNIGDHVGNKWEHDPCNHNVVYIHPLNIGYVTNGNHSTVVNIINNETPMVITEMLDLTSLYRDIYTDGEYFKKKSDGSLIDEVTSVEFAAIFEIGRLIISNNLQETFSENKL